MNSRNSLRFRACRLCVLCALLRCPCKYLNREIRLETADSFVFAVFNFMVIRPLAEWRANRAPAGKKVSSDDFC